MKGIDDLQEEAKEAVRDHRFQDAADLLRETIVVSEKHASPMEIYSTNMGLSMFLESVVEDDIGAEPYREIAVEIIKQAGGYGASEVAENIRSLAELKARLGKLDEAKMLMSEADTLYPSNTQQEATEKSAQKAR